MVGQIHATEPHLMNRRWRAELEGMNASLPIPRASIHWREQTWLVDMLTSRVPGPVWSPSRTVARVKAEDLRRCSMARRITPDCRGCMAGFRLAATASLLLALYAPAQGAPDPAATLPTALRPGMGLGGIPMGHLLDLLALHPDHRGFEFTQLRVLGVPFGVGGHHHAHAVMRNHLLDEGRSKSRAVLSASRLVVIPGMPMPPPIPIPMRGPVPIPGLLP